MVGAQASQPPVATCILEEEKECVLQDMNRVYAYCAFAFSCFIAQLSFVLKKTLRLQRLACAISYVAID